MDKFNLKHELSALSAKQAAARLIGSDLIRLSNGGRMVGRIVETEAYDQSDSASHSFRGLTPRTKVMFGPAGVAYVYFTYGMHYCMNVVVGEAGEGAAVLIRALEPLEGVELMEYNRGAHAAHGLLNGPAKLAQAFAIERSFNGHDLSQPPLLLQLNKALSPDLIGWSERIGVRETDGTHRLWRATLRGSSYLSRRE